MERVLTDLSDPVSNIKHPVVEQLCENRIPGSRDKPVSSKEGLAAALFVPLLNDKLRSFHAEGLLKNREIAFTYFMGMEFSHQLEKVGISKPDDTLANVFCEKVIRTYPMFTDNDSPPGHPTWVNIVAAVLLYHFNFRLQQRFKSKLLKTMRNRRENAKNGEKRKIRKINNDDKESVQSIDDIENNPENADDGFHRRRDAILSKKNADVEEILRFIPEYRDITMVIVNHSLHLQDNSVNLSISDLERLLAI